MSDEVTNKVNRIKTYLSTDNLDLMKSTGSNQKTALARKLNRVNSVLQIIT